MPEKEIVETSEAQIAVYGQVEGYYPPSLSVVAQSEMTDPTICG